MRSPHAPARPKGPRRRKREYDPESLIAAGKWSPAQREKIDKVLDEFNRGTLKSSDGSKVTNKKQALAIALSEAKQLTAAGFDETKHPRHGKGDPQGGQFSAKDAVDKAHSGDEGARDDDLEPGSPEADLEDRAQKYVEQGYEPVDSEPGEWIQLDHPDGKSIVLDVNDEYDGSVAAEGAEEDDGEADPFATDFDEAGGHEVQGHAVSPGEKHPVEIQSGHATSGYTAEVLDGPHPKPEGAYGSPNDDRYWRVRLDRPTLFSNGQQGPQERLMHEDELLRHKRSETASALTAAAAGLAPMRPPKDWFEKPTLEGPTPITVTADGRVFGHAALWGTCHTGMPGVCRTPPRSSSDYAYFHLGEVDTDDGPVHVGRVSMDTGHAPLTASKDGAVRHYDDTGTGAAHVRAYEDDHGIVLAGALMPDIPAEKARRFKGATVSGDWRSIGGKLELVGMLAVNVPGFPVPRAMAASLIVEDEDHTMALVAAGIYTSPDDQDRKLRSLTARALGGLDGLAAAALGGTPAQRRMGVTAAASPFDPSKHPRHPGGSPEGGRWARVTYPDGTVEYKQGLPSQVVKEVRAENPGTPVANGQPGSIKVAPVDKPPEEDKRVREGGAAKAGDTVEFSRHGGTYHATVMSVGPQNAKVQYRTKNHKVKTVSVPHSQYKVI